MSERRTFVRFPRAIIRLEHISSVVPFETADGKKMTLIRFSRAAALGVDAVLVKQNMAQVWKRIVEAMGEGCQ